MESSRATIYTIRLCLNGNGQTICGLCVCVLAKEMEEDGEGGTFKASFLGGEASAVAPPLSHHSFLHFPLARHHPALALSLGTSSSCGGAPTSRGLKRQKYFTGLEPLASHGPGPSYITITNGAWEPRRLLAAAGGQLAGFLPADAAIFARSSASLSSSCRRRSRAGRAQSQYSTAWLF